MSSLIVSGDTSGAITVSAPAAAGSGTLTLPTGTDTLVGKATTDTLTNKTVTAPVLSGTITGTYTLAGTPTITSPTLTTPALGTPASGVLTNCTGLPALSTASGSAPSYSARAWVNFNGTGTPAINGSGNVSSITDGGTGIYTVNFTTAMADVNYAVSISCNKDNDINDGSMRMAQGTNTTVVPTSSASPITIMRGDGSAVDPSRVFCVIFR